MRQSIDILQFHRQALENREVLPEHYFRSDTIWLHKNLRKCYKDGMLDGYELYDFLYDLTYYLRPGSPKGRSATRSLGLIMGRTIIPDTEVYWFIAHILPKSMRYAAMEASKRIPIVEGPHRCFELRKVIKVIRRYSPRAKCLHCRKRWRTFQWGNPELALCRKCERQIELSQEWKEEGKWLRIAKQQHKEVKKLLRNRLSQEAQPQRGGASRRATTSRN